jgi:hypothetical protein
MPPLLADPSQTRRGPPAINPLISPEQAATQQSIFGGGPGKAFNPETDTPDNPDRWLKQVKPVGMYQGWGGLASIGEGLHNAAVYSRANEARGEQRASQRAGAELMQSLLANPDGAAGPAGMAKLMSNPNTAHIGQQLFMHAQDRAARQADPMYQAQLRHANAAEERAAATHPLELQLKQAQEKRSQGQEGRAQNAEALDLEHKRMTIETQKNADARAKEAMEQDKKFNELIFPSAPGSKPAAQSPGQPVPGQGAIKPMSYDGAPDGDPNLINVADPAKPTAADDAKMVDTPLGRVTVERANQLGMAFAMKKNHDMAKQFFEAVKESKDKLGKAAGDVNDKNQLGYVNHLGRLDEIDRNFDTKHFEVSGKLKMLGTAWSEKLGMKPSPEKAEELTKYTAFRAEAVGNFNALLKEASGTAVTESELKRMTLQEPNAGSGVFDGDSATEFKAKLKQSKDGLKMAIARANYLRENGYKGAVTDGVAARVPLSGMQKILEREAETLHKKIEISNPGMPEEQIMQQVKGTISKRFGWST